MKKILSRYLPPIFALVAALLLDVVNAPAAGYVLTLCVLIALFPLVKQVGAELINKKRIDLGLPVVVTILILLFLGDLKTAAVFVLLVLAGRLLNDYVLWKVKRSVEDISEALPDTAQVRRGSELAEVKIVEIRKGDVIALKAGSRVPVDGTLLAESASFDESVATGESRPVAKKKADRLIAGAINVSGYAEMVAEETSANSTIAQVKGLVEQAQSRSAPLSRFTDVYAKATVVATLVLCGALYVATRDVTQALALWIALVPVVFAIIVPVSTTLGISLLAKRGVLIKSAEAVENLTKIGVIAFDKTGTLTKGKPEVVDVRILAGFDRADVLRFAASVEKYSEHHLGAAIVRDAEKEGLTLLPAGTLKTLKGKGIEAECGGKRILIGNRLLLTESAVALTPETDAAAREKEDAGSSAVFVAIDGALAGVFSIADAVRENAGNVVRELQGMGFELVMLTGDSGQVARKIAADLGIGDVRAECLPQDKIRHIMEMKKAGKKVGMIGDGINDAPALAEADVGIAMGLRGVDVTLEAAQAVLIHDDLEVLPETIRAARRIFGAIKGDLVIATAVHVVTAALVVGRVIGILGSTLLHQVSSTLVLLNTLRLFRLGPARPNAAKTP